MVIYYKGKQCHYSIFKYSNDRLALNVIQTQGGYIWFASVNVPWILLQPYEVVIKNYAENAGILDALLYAQVVKLRRVLSMGDAEYAVVKLMVTVR